MFVSKFPLIKILISLIFGILLAKYAPWEFSSHYLLASLSFFILLLLLDLGKCMPFKPLVNSILSSTSILIIFFLIGFGNSRFNQFDKNKLELIELPLQLIVEIEEVLKPTKYHQRYLGKILMGFKENNPIWVQERLLLKLKKGNTGLIPSDQIHIKGDVKLIDPPANPAQFDYAAYLANKNVYYRISSNEWLKVDSNFSMHRIAFQFREKLILELEKVMIHKENLNILKALLLGDKSELNTETRTSFAHAGAMHVLAVSGLHLGIIYLLFAQLFKLIDLQRKKFFNAFLLLSVIWGFALISGFSVSVQRAALMFSFILVAEPLQRKNVSINSLAASAFILLMIDPSQLFDVGFQLSYSAVLGILIFYPAFKFLISSQNKILEKIISLMLVSFCAVLATLPFSLYYFHYFPSYFLLSNLIIVPLAFVIVGIGVLLCFCWMLFGRSFFLDQLLDMLLSFLMRFIELIDSLPVSTIEPIWPDKLSVFFMIMAIVFLAIYLARKKSIYFILLVSCALSVFFTEAYQEYSISQESQLTIYSNTRMNAMSIRHAMQAKLILLDSISDFDQEMVNRHLNSIGIEEFDIDSSLLKDHKNELAINLEGLKLGLFNDCPKEIREEFDLVLIRNPYLGQACIDNVKSCMIASYAFEDLKAINFFQLRNRALVIEL